MRRLITLIGPTCTGKSTLEKSFNQRGIKSVISYTTRSPRTGEIDGKDYTFLPTVEDVEVLENAGKVIQKVYFGGHYYGSTTMALDEAFSESDLAVIVVEPTGLTQFINYAATQDDLEVVSVYIDNPLETLVWRLAQRYKNDLNADPVYYRRRMAGLIIEHQDWPYYTDDWTFYFDELDEDVSVHTVESATDLILGTFGR